MKIIIKSLSIVARDNISEIINTTSIPPYGIQVDVSSNGDFSTVLPFVIVSISIAVIGLVTTAYFSDSGDDSDDDHFNSIPTRLRDNIIGTEQDETSRIGSPIEFRRSLPPIEEEIDL